MARGGRSGAGSVIDGVALLPWWAGIGLALATHVLFDRLATPPAGPMQAGQMGVFAQHALVAGVAGVARWGVPSLCLLGALVSFLRRRKRRALLGSVTRSDAALALEGMSWRDFELLVGESFRRQGYQVVEQGGARADGGVDLILRKDHETFLVQCKHWKAFKVGVGVVRELFGVMAARGATGGFVVTSGSFTAEAKAFVDGRNVTLVDGPALARRIREVGARTPESTTGMARVKTTPTAEPTQDTRATMSTAKATATATATTTMAAPHERPAAMATTTAAETPPTCPTCQSAMVRRMARTGPRAGASFWGCSRFPSCRGTR